MNAHASGRQHSRETACSQAKRLHGRLMKDVMRPQLFKSWIALSTGQITIQRISIKENQLRYPLNRDLSGG